MRGTIWGIAGVGLGIAAVAGGIAFAMQPCGPLDGSGCVAAFTISHMSGLGDTIVPAPDGEGTIWVAGSYYEPTDNPYRHTPGIYLPRIAVARVDVGSGKEISRLSPTDTGSPWQLQVSQDGTRLAIANSTIYSHSADLIVLDAEGETLWTHEFDDYDLPPDAEGRAVAIAFGAEGELFADPLAFDARGYPIDPRPVERRWIETARTGVDLPEGFVPWTYATKVPSPDGAREAVLVRRFHGPHESVRAILEIRDAATGATAVRHEIGDDLNAALAWDPLGRGVIVARAGKFEPNAGTQLRIYTAEARP